jgi:hypothetical protein
VQDGFDPEKVKDRLYFHRAEGGYKPLNAKLYEKIASGAVRL